MKRIMIMAGGTATAWHIAKTIKNNFRNIKLYVCDINPSYKVHTSTLADEFVVVPPIKTSGYYSYMINLFEKEKIDIIVPLIDYDIMLFYQDNDDLMKKNIFSSAPKKGTVDLLSNKRNMSKFLTDINIETPREIFIESLERDKEYFVKDIIGFGSRDAFKSTGEQLKDISDNRMIQELCMGPEITADVIWSGEKVFTICRERLEVKAGVCTKARLFYDDYIQQVIEKIADYVELPTISCVQFMKNQAGNWSLTDFNLRSGGGTALSASVGFQAVRAAVNIWLDEKCDVTDLLPKLATEKYAVRVYEEIVTK